MVSRRTTRPLTALAAAAGAVGRGEPDAEKLLRPGPGELGQVSAAFAAMARTLRREDNCAADMVADTAHELRTPVTILQGATEELLDGLAAPTPGKLTSLHDETLRLGRLVDDLSTLAAAKSAALTLHHAPADLAKIALRRRRRPPAPVRRRRGAAGPGHQPPRSRQRRRGPPHPGRHQPADQRRQVHPARRAGHPHHQHRGRDRCQHHHRPLDHRPHALPASLSVLAAAMQPVPRTCAGHVKNRSLSAAPAAAVRNQRANSQEGMTCEQESGGPARHWRTGGGGTTFPASARPVGITTSLPSRVRTAKECEPNVATAQAPGAHGCGASGALRDPTRTASFVALVIAVWRRLRCNIIHQLVVAG